MPFIKYLREDDPTLSDVTDKGFMRNKTQAVLKIDSDMPFYFLSLLNLPVVVDQLTLIGINLRKYAATKNNKTNDCS